MESECQRNKKKMPEVCVLLSAYNGEKYIGEQIDSILAQTYGNIRLYVRDDGSADGTADILREYEREGKLRCIRGENKGFIDSFFELLKICGDAEYYAWCDQDDVWLPEKIERAVKVLEENKGAEELPMLYFSDYDYYDENMDFQGHGLDYRRGPSFANSLMDCISLGFTSVFNRRAREKMAEHIPKYSCGHDWWTYMLCAAFGKVIYDRGQYMVKYRRLEKSVSPGGKNFIELQVWRFQKFFLNGYFEKIRMQLREFAFLYGKELKPEDRKVLWLFIRKRYSFLRAIRKACYPVWFRQGMVEECMVRILFLIGRL